MSKKILIVEDERIIAEDIKKTLTGFGYQVLNIVSSGEEAILQCNEEKPELVLMDIVLEGDLNGVETGRKIYEKYNIPIVFLTSYADDKTLESAKVANPFGYLVKPFEDKELHASLEIAFYKGKMDELLHESERKYRNLVESIQEGIVILDKKLYFKFVNNAASDIFDYHKRDLLKKNLKGFATSEELKFLTKKFEKINEGNPIRFDMTIKTRTGRKKIMEINANPVFDKELFEGTLAVLNDITSRKKMEIALKESEQNLTKEVSELKNRLYESTETEHYLGKSEAIQKVIKQIDLIAQTNMSVIIQGKSGTGKEVMANLIHQRSKRKNKPFIAIDCGAIPPTLIESVMFGYEKGAFTGADNKKIGKFEQANKGTLLLDELTNLPEGGQMGLLRAIEERIIYRVGGKEPIPIDVRIIATTNVNLLQKVKNQNFREDLFHRLNEFQIVLPNLKERKDDIEFLAQYFISEANKELKKEVKGLTASSLKSLLEYDWPGNVRELKHLIRRAVLLAEDDLINPEQLQFNSSDHKDQNWQDFIKKNTDKIFHRELTLTDLISNLTNKTEKEIILKILRKTRFNKSKTAEILGIDRTTLYTKLKQLKIIS